ncbi:sulfur carrier protein ThiS [Olsenella uli]|uniref:sulfur carrier protein ThiS n=1 Tax=Olsenella uli TaxID=133926 RepID=UPI00195DBCAB|nr:sulfur carrier protein ThiS [Olsenella uli]MBM6676310.1 sulfur carrier protein ThiS [Olsenella uli]
MVRINGRPAPEADGRTVAELLEQMGYERARVACELNGEILPRAEFDARRLTAEDALEVVRFVGGG